MNALHKELARLAEQAQAQDLASEKWRLGFHLMPPVGWLNDPNGLCRFRGVYHVFYQYSPFDAQGGLKLWGHYESPDLLHWRQDPPALYPDEPYDCHGVYSGSALAEEDGLYLYYTGNVKQAGDYDYITAGREHNTVLAYSPDGQTFVSKRLLLRNCDYPAGLTCHVRDPKVWRENGRYYMVQGARTLDNAGVAVLFESADRVLWHPAATIRSGTPCGYMWECPDIFTLDGQRFLSVSPQGVPREQTRLQNVYHSGWFALSGDFPGGCKPETFTEYDYGFDFYAPQTFADGDRRLLIAWMGLPDVEDEYINPTAALGWQHALTIPRELSLRDGQIFQTPARELASLRGDCVKRQVRGADTLAWPRRFDLELELETQTAVRIFVRDCAEICWENGLLSLSFLRGGCGRTIRRAPLQTLRRLRLLADESSLELFANDGERVMTSRYYPETDGGLTVFCAKASLSLWEMNAMELEKRLL